MDKNKSLSAVAALVVVLSSAAYFHSRPGPIRVGFVGTLSGKYGVLGSTARDGAVLAVEQINRAGGIRGRKIDLVIKDDEGDPEKARAIAESIADMGIRFLIGPFLTASGTAVLPVINERRVLTISGTTMGQNLADRDDYYFVLIPAIDHYGKEIATLALGKGQLRFAAVSDSRNDPYCPSFVAGIRMAMAGIPGSSLQEVNYSTSLNVPYSDIVAPIDPVNTDAVFLCASSLDTAFLAQNLKRTPNSTALYSAAWGISRELIQNGGQAVDGLSFFLPIDERDRSETYVSFKKEFLKRFKGEPTFVSTFNYEAIKILEDSLRKTRNHETSFVKKLILEKPEHPGVQGNFSLDREGDAVRPLYLHTIRNGSFVYEGRS